MDDNTFFKSSRFGGFNKEDVLEYLDRNNEKHAEEKEELKKELKKLNQERNHYANQVQFCDQELTRLQQQIETLAGQIQIQNDVIQSQTAEINMHLARIHEKDQDISLQSDTIKRLTVRIESLEYKYRYYDSLQKNASELFKDFQTEGEYFTKELHEQTQKSMYQTNLASKQLNQRIDSSLAALSTIEEQTTEAYEKLGTYFLNLKNIFTNARKTFDLENDSSKNPYIRTLENGNMEIGQLLTDFFEKQSKFLSSSFFHEEASNEPLEYSIAENPFKSPNFIMPKKEFSETIPEDLIDQNSPEKVTPYTKPVKLSDASSKVSSLEAVPMSYSDVENRQPLPEDLRQSIESFGASITEKEEDPSEF